ncbi:hypothetical protein ACFORJ_13455 [Corynebacterium hansenii]|uniref:Uncharacterized protein n=1 Tax=Corynebacterium hansenii TaxID=394964 RepID=A0ABV7ZSI4_9CORY|nr:hypothetical protein [Corynebacterium hansenii]WJY99759.1 hypothetical protein CHAN_05700 [Corynebacterium hansenii]
MNPTDAAETIDVNVIEISIFAERWRADLLLGRLALAIGARLGAVDAGFDVAAVEPGGDEDEWDLADQWRQLNADAAPPADKSPFKVTAWFTGELKGADDDGADTADEDESLAIILDALDGLALAGVGEADLDYDGPNPDHVPFGDARYAIELPRETVRKGADVGPEVAAAVARLRGLVAAGRGPAPQVTSVQVRTREAFEEALAGERRP